MLRTIEIPGPQGQHGPLADKAMAAITRADVEAVRQSRREAMATPTTGDPSRRPGSRQGLVGINRLLARLRHAFNWAIGAGYIDVTPFVRHGVSVVKLDTRAEVRRPRRLLFGEEEALLAAAESRLQALIIAALSTGARLGELLSLQWSQIRRDAHGRPAWIDLPVERTKAYEPRLIPIGMRLRSVLAMRETDPKGHLLPPSAHVFGLPTGEPIRSIKTAWRGACRRAGIEGLRFHDLRREFACRLMESKALLHDVREFLGHADVSTTSRYLKSAPVRLAEALERMEAAETFAHDSHKRPTTPDAPSPKDSKTVD